MNEASKVDQPEIDQPAQTRPRPWLLGGTFAATLIGTLTGALLAIWGLVTMVGHQQEPAAPVADVSEISTDPEPWGLNWPHQFDGWKATAGDGVFGGSSALPQSKLDTHPWLKRLYAGYAFSIDYREARGHAYMLYDQGVTERLTKKPQPGACLHCHASTSVLYRRIGMEALGEEVTPETLAVEFNQPAVMRGFEELNGKAYQEVLTLLLATPDGTPDENEPVFPSAPAGGNSSEDTGEPLPQGHVPSGEAHPVTCIDCHDPKTMAMRVTRPGFLNGIAALAAGDAALPHLPSIDQWRTGPRDQPYNPNQLASRQEMRSFVCGQCHVEYSVSNNITLTYPWAKGLRADDEEAFWDDFRLPDGSAFYDFKNGETGAPSYKAEHPEFELWSQGIHARAGVSCADCHMPNQQGEEAMTLSDHRVTSPLENVKSACQSCHPVSESELRAWVATIQTRTRDLTQRAAVAMTAMLDAIREAQAAGATDAELAEVFTHQRKATWRLDYISSENSKGFHADQEAARVLAESIDHSRQAQALALRWRAPETPDVSVLFSRPVRGVTPEQPPETANP
ncbi:ammonia-forming cytochrome c nitrite reductase subunit c552 [Thiorhodovibrio frisius]|uniref:nitrite reductase (cytochrome; ammonia-forming) n=1 Tax=Thiorhodovibrio frisius TaxID=631362 RepID=H8Z560_9GAMM|nr:ammonia-forming cytochrome c nitrite reductase subunit c552 [Thiorhodovibrio frisius]EIC20467.1 formate-dependent nitrite reductase, periplasmic cytochrome c552 subunit [Thiorhodovibrio frisius]WPL21211.1 Cytochrome c-552 precursor [Thiorhodovibrio frisius]